MMHTYRRALIVHDDVRFVMKLNMIPDRLRPERMSHVKMAGKWRIFGETCGFKIPKMMRMKLMDIVQEVVDGENMRVPLFQVC